MTPSGDPNPGAEPMAMLHDRAGETIRSAPGRASEAKGNTPPNPVAFGKG